MIYQMNRCQAMQVMLLIAWLVPFRLVGQDISPGDVAVGMAYPDCSGAPAAGVDPIANAVTRYERRDILETNIPPLFEAAAANGDVRGKLWISRLMFKGRCRVPLQVEEAQRMARSVINDVRVQAEAGDVESQFLLGAAYQEGLGVDLDTSSALTWLATATSNGHITAINNLAVMLAQGQGIDPDIEKARVLFSQAASMGSRRAMENQVAFEVRPPDERERLKQLMATPVLRALGMSRVEGIAFLVKEGLITDPAQHEDSPYFEKTSMKFSQDGIVIHVDIGGRITNIEGHAGGPGASNRFRGELPMGMQWTDTREAAMAKLGDPDDSGDVAEDHAWGMAHRIDNVFFSVMFSYAGQDTLKIWRVYEKWGADYSSL